MSKWWMASEEVEWEMGSLHFFSTKHHQENWQTLSCTFSCTTRNIWLSKLTVLKQWVTISTTECRKISYTDFVYSTIIRSNAFLQSTAWAAIFFFHRFDNFNERQNSKNKSNGLKVLRQSLVKPQLIIPPTLASRQHRGIRNLGTNKNANKE